MANKIVRIGLLNKPLAMALIVSVAACAGTGANYSPMVDTRSIDASRYYTDLAECQAFARNQPGAADNAAAGALVGALIGLVFAAATHDRAYNGVYAGVGAASGGMSGAVAGEQGQRDVIRKCLQGRGYSVLN